MNKCKRERKLYNFQNKSHTLFPLYIMFLQGVSKLCAINDMGGSGR
jgi:hypothetical protein